MQFHAHSVHAGGGRACTRCHLAPVWGGAGREFRLGTPLELRPGAMPFDALIPLVLRLAHGILAIQSQASPVAFRDAVSWAVAAAVHGQRSELDPFELIAIARNETDFRPNVVGPDGKDCGLTQTRVTYSRYRCGELRRSPWLSFAEAARELKANQVRCLRNAPNDVTRCRINSYNSGVKYARGGWPGRYWLRVSCFAEAARGGVAPGGNCRLVRSWADVQRIAGNVATAWN